MNIRTIIALATALTCSADASQSTSISPQQKMYTALACEKNFFYGYINQLSLFFKYVPCSCDATKAFGPLNKVDSTLEKLLHNYYLKPLLKKHELCTESYDQPERMIEQFFIWLHKNNIIFFTPQQNTSDHPNQRILFSQSWKNKLACVPANKKMLVQKIIELFCQHETQAKSRYFQHHQQTLCISQYCSTAAIEPLPNHANFLCSLAFGKGIIAWLYDNNEQKCCSCKSRLLYVDISLFLEQIASLLINMQHPHLPSSTTGTEENSAFGKQAIIAILLGLKYDNVIFCKKPVDLQSHPKSCHTLAPTWEEIKSTLPHNTHLQTVTEKFKDFDTHAQNLIKQQCHEDNKKHTSHLSSTHQ